MDVFPSGTPTRGMLDALVSDRPVGLTNRDGHGLWVNTRALEIAGIDAQRPDPDDGRIDREADGTPSGTLQEGALALLGEHVPSHTARGCLRGPAARPGSPALARHHRLAGRDGRRLPRPPGLARHLLPRGPRRHPHRTGRRRTLVGPRARPGAGPRTGGQASAGPPRTVQRHHRQDHAGRRHGELHRRDARPLPRQDLLRAGTRLVAGSDWPVSSADPLWGIHTAVNCILPDEAPTPAGPTHRPRSCPSRPSPSPSR
ncbi:amidohydrolase family protein [Streptomyces exfoliatus]|uniref:amidohydrolase family protein n=1 Tax=Streptomyces exfoliatus TaxID=1905 RepID=UPI003C2C16F9